MGSVNQRREIQLSNEVVVILSAISRLVSEVPDELLRVSSRERADLYAAVAELDHWVGLHRANFTRQTAMGLLPMPPMSWLDKQPKIENNRYAFEVIQEVLSNCPDDVILPSTRDLAFIADNDWRTAIRLDLSVVDSALSNGEYKPATVVGGSVLEALLLCGLLKKNSADLQSYISKTGLGLKSPPEEWNLHQYIEVAAAGNLIGKESIQLARVAKDFRNLIHPGRAQRLSQRCSRGTAFAVVSAIEHVIDDFTKNPP